MFCSNQNRALLSFIENFKQVSNDVFCDNNPLDPQYLTSNLEIDPSQDSLSPEIIDSSENFHE